MALPSTGSPTGLTKYRTRRRNLITFCVALAGFGGLLTSRQSQSQERERALESLEEIRRALEGRKGREAMSKEEIRKLRQLAREQDVREVERLYSTKPIRVRLATRQYVIPANYFNPKGRNEPDTLEVKALGFRLFLPTYEGFTKDNWKDWRFNTDRIDIAQVKPIDKNAMIPNINGERQRITPAAYGEPKAGFKNLQRIYDRNEALDAHGLEAYTQRRGSGRALWTGTRSNGEFFFFWTTATPGEPPSISPRFYLCDVRYYSEQEDLFIAYNYSMNQMAKWQEIDTTIWKKLHEWMVK